jgi:hypothetical protein
LIGSDNARTKLRTYFVCPDGIEIAQADGPYQTFLLQIAQNIQRGQIIRIRVILPMKLKCNKKIKLGIEIVAMIYLEQIDLTGSHTTHALSDGTFHEFTVNDCRAKYTPLGRADDVVSVARQ